MTERVQPNHPRNDPLDPQRDPSDPGYGIPPAPNKGNSGGYPNEQPEKGRQEGDRNKGIPGPDRDETKPGDTKPM